MGWLPDIPLIMRLRGAMYGVAMQHCGRNFQVAASATLRGLENIHCGDDIYVGPNTFILARKRIEINSQVLVAMNVVVVDANHGKQNNSYRFHRGSAKDIIIGRGVWIAANSVVVAGAIINDGTLIPPCSVVR